MFVACGIWCLADVSSVPFVGTCRYVKGFRQYKEVRLENVFHPIQSTIQSDISTTGWQKCGLETFPHERTL